MWCVYMLYTTSYGVTSDNLNSDLSSPHSAPQKHQMWGSEQNQGNFQDLCGFLRPFQVKTSHPAASAALSVNNDPTLATVSLLTIFVCLCLRAASKLWCLHGPSGHSQSEDSWTSTNMKPCGDTKDHNMSIIVCYNRCLTFISADANDALRG